MLRIQRIMCIFSHYFKLNNAQNRSTECAMPLVQDTQCPALMQTNLKDHSVALFLPVIQTYDALFIQQYKMKGK